MRKNALRRLWTKGANDRKDMIVPLRERPMRVPAYRISDFSPINNWSQRIACGAASPLGNRTNGLCLMNSSSSL
jgi:hypothetical protein